MKKYSIGKFAKYSGVTPDFIKYYEKHHIMIPSVEPNGYRSYEMPDFAILIEYIRDKCISDLLAVWRKIHLPESNDSN